MNNDHEEQTKWLVSYLETRFGRLEDRLDQAIMAQSVKIDALEEKVNQLENDHLKLSNQAGLVRNLLAFIGTGMLSLLGWAITYFWPTGGK
jgi:hypothetical protein